jgi:hypothetical protein
MIYEADIYTGPCSVRIPLHQGAGLIVWVQNPGRVKIFSPLQKRLDWLWGTPSLLFSGHQSSSLGTEFDPSPPSSVKVKNERSYTSAPPVCLHWVDRNSFAFNFYIQISSDSTNTLLSSLFLSFFLSVYADPIIQDFKGAESITQII